MVLLQKWPFFQLSFLGNIGQKNVIYDIQEGKNASLGYKNKKFKKSKNSHFSKGVTHGFGLKMTIFQLFFLDNMGQKNVIYVIVDRKNASVGYKNRKFKKSKN